MNKWLKLLAPVILSIYISCLFAGPGWAQFVPMGISSRAPELNAYGPEHVSFNEVFTAEAGLSEYGYSLSSFISMEVIVPKGFEIIDYGVFNEKTKTYKAIIKAPNRLVNKEEIIFKLRYEWEGMRMEVESTYNNAIIVPFFGKSSNYKISVNEPVYLRYGIDPKTVPTDYQGNINLAVGLETLPSIFPLGYYALGEQWGGRNDISPSQGSVLPKLLETIACFYAFTPTENDKGEKQVESSRVLFGVGIYLGALLLYDLPNIYKDYIARTEIARLKQEGKIK